MATTLQTGSPTGRESMSEKLAGAGWGLFFLWIGVSILVTMPSWLALLGVGVITLGVQVARVTQDLRIEGFWVTVGALFFAAALWDVSGTTVQLLPVLLIVVGGGVLVSLFRRK